MFSTQCEYQDIVPPHEATSSINTDLRRSSSPEEEDVAGDHQEFDHLLFSGEPMVPGAGEPGEPVLPGVVESELSVAGEPELSMGSQAELLAPCDDVEQASNGAGVMNDNQNQP
ncbi:hypothetical protein V6N11_074466 [Hibiscus sabdariffa]|uniref:Uncharacterized protein n=1 Tax=Hibiscus sabdariffa TaxID=183260 RepID=A0ABR2R3M4_9ROSI